MILLSVSVAVPLCSVTSLIN